MSTEKQVSTLPVNRHTPSTTTGAIPGSIIFVDVYTLLSVEDADRDSSCRCVIRLVAKSSNCLFCASLARARRVLASHNTRGTLLTRRTTMNRQYLLVRRPREPSVNKDDMKIVEVPKPVPMSGDVVVQNLFASVDPTHRVWMSDTPQYWEPSPLNEPMRATTLGVVEVSREPRLPVGTLILGLGSLQDYYITSVDDPTTAHVVPIPGIPITAYLSILSVIIAATAWVAVFEVMNVGEGEVVVVSAGSGAVGSLAVQLAKIRGGFVIAICGTDEKCKFSLDVFGANASINHKTECVESRLRDIVPDGVDCFLDLTGGDISDSVFQCMKNFGRVAVGGTISSYCNEGGYCPMKNYTLLVHRRLSVQGFICSDHVDKMDIIIPQLVEWIKSGQIKYYENVVLGLENYLVALESIFTGLNTGKVLLQLAEYNVGEL